MPGLGKAFVRGTTDGLFRYDFCAWAQKTLAFYLRALSVDRITNNSKRLGAENARIFLRALSVY